MSLPIIFRPEASLETEYAEKYHENERAGFGQEFVDRLDILLEQIKQHPRTHAKIWRNVRAARIWPFAFVAYYRVLKDRIEILAVMHGHRSDAAWKSRARR